MFRILPLGSVGDLAPNVGLPECIALNFSSPMFVQLKVQSVVCLILSFPKIYEHFWGPKRRDEVSFKATIHLNVLLVAAVGLADPSYVCEKS